MVVLGLLLLVVVGLLLLLLLLLLLRLRRRLLLLRWLRLVLWLRCLLVSCNCQQPELCCQFLLLLLLW